MPPLPDIYLHWTHEVTDDVWASARRYASGGGRNNLKVQTGRTRDSLKQMVQQPSQYLTHGDVYSNHPPAIIWEEYGVTGPLRPQHGAKAMLLMLRRAFTQWTQMGLIRRKRRVVFSDGTTVQGYRPIFRSATYTITRRKEPVRFMTRALRNELTNYNGVVNLNRLGVRVATEVAQQIGRDITAQHPHITVTIR